MATKDSFMYELDHRENDGISVTLWWFTPDNELTVTVDDRKTGENFSINNIPHDRAREYFEHPYAGRLVQHENYPLQP